MVLQKRQEPTPNQFSEYLERAMEEKGWDILTLAKAVDISYEHTRKLIRGLAQPSKFLLRQISQVLDLDFEEMNKFVVADQIKKRYGGVPSEISNKLPSLEPVERVWPSLSIEQQSDVITLVQGWAKRNRVAH